MTEVNLVCSGGPFDKLEFVVPEKEPLVYEVIRGMTRQLYEATTTKDGVATAQPKTETR